MQPLRKANPLGDIRAEGDHDMLTSAFYESPDYKTVIETFDRTVIVGRRGTGQSALFFKVGRHWRDAANTQVLNIAPEEHEIIGMRAIVEPLGPRFNLIRAGARLAWRYALILEIGSAISSH
jgi:hypothetical protein